MALKRLFPKDEVRRRCDRFMQAVELQHLTGLTRIGENFVTNSRLRGSYQDRTANLRNSTGYTIIINGEVRSMTSQMGEGGTKANEHMKSIVSRKRQAGITSIIGVAGMEYAADVESRGYDVITSSTETALQEQQVMMQNIRKRMSK